MPTTSSCRFLRILAHDDGSRSAWGLSRNTTRSVLTVGSKGPRNGFEEVGRIGTVKSACRQQSVDHC
jgi:hypothetical protein